MPLLRSVLAILVMSFLTGRIDAQTNVSGEITANTTWVLSGSPYILTSSVLVKSGATLTIASGVSVNFQTWNTLVIGQTGVSSAQLQANGVTFSTGAIQFQNASGGTISGCTFTGASLTVNDQSAPTVSNNSFDGISPLYIHCQDVVPKISANTFANTHINVSGTFTTSTTLAKFPGADYYLDASLYVRSGATLTIGSGASVNFQTWNTLVIGQTGVSSAQLQANGVTFSTGAIQFQNASGGTISGCTFTGASLTVNDQSAPTISNNSFDGISPLYIHCQDVVPKISGNTFANTHINVSGTFTISTTLAKFPGADYYLDASLYVRSGATLTIGSGASVNFQTWNTLVIGQSGVSSAQLQANGVTFSTGAIQFQNASGGTIRGGNFSSVNFNFYDQSTLTIGTSNLDANCNLTNQSSNVVNATENYWGDASGPYHVTLHPSGKGSKLSGNINFIPFLTSIVITNVAQYPVLLVSSPSIILGNSIAVSGYSCTPNSVVSLIVTGTSVSHSQTTQINTSASGSFTNLFQSSTSTPPGDYVVQCVDISSGRSSSQVAFEIIAPLIQPAFGLLSPSTGFEGKTGQAIAIVWTDKMFKSVVYPISGAYRSYWYTVELSSDGGSTWSQLASKQDSALLDQNVTITQPITINQPGDAYVVRVTDVYQNNRKAISPSFAVTSLASNLLQVNFAWDYTFNDRTGEPTGVAADGVSRIYLSLLKKNPSTGPSITGVTLHISDGKNLGTLTLGKVMIASITDRFTDEANNASSIQVSDNTSKSQYWFWYVSPEDFVGSNPQDSLNASRTVHALFNATYSDGSQESISRDIVITRPPLVFIHGLGGGPGTWGVFPYNTPSGSEVFFLNDPRFVVERAVRMAPQAHFWENASILLSSPDAVTLNPNSFASAVRAMHDHGLAANQVDCVTHSMGGSMVRQAVTYSPSFYRQFNYSQGYIHKFITLDTPHLGSPFADIVDGIISDFNALPLSAFHPILSALKFDVWSLLTALYDPFSQSIVPCLYQPADGYVINSSGALEDLKVTGGVRFPQTSIKSHLVSGDIIGGDLSLPTIPPQIEALISDLNDEVEFFDKAFDMLCVVGTPDLRDFLEQATGYSKIKRIVTLIDYLANIYTGVSFLAESDVVVDVNSQLSGLGRTAPNSTVINGLNHLMVTNDPNVGNEVNRLLNMSLSGSGAFAAIPATSIQQVAKVTSKSHLAANSNVTLDNSKIALVSPSPGSRLFCDSTITCHVAITDTVGLRYVKVYFQHDSYTFKKAFDIELTVQVNASYLDTNCITALAIYDYGDSTLFAKDTVNVVVTPGTTLTRFDVTPRVFSLATGETDRPQYKAIYRNCISDLGISRGTMQVRLSSPGIVRYNPTTNSFTGLSVGQAFAMVSYGGLTDTVYFIVAPGTVLGIGGDGKMLGTTVPDQFKLFQNFPNPFNPATTIRYGLPQRSHVAITVFNVLGQKVMTLVQEIQTAGYHEVKFDGSNFASGVYFYRIHAGSFIQTKKLLLLR